MRPKPATITVVQTILWISVAACGVLILVVAKANADPGPDAPDGHRLISGAVVAVVLPIAIVNMVLAVNLGKQRNWARITTIVIHLLALAVSAGVVIAGIRGFGADVLIGAAFNLFIIACLSGRGTKRWFTSANPAATA